MFGCYVDRCYGEHPPFALYQFCTKDGGDAACVDGCRHDDYLQVGTYHILRLTHKGKGGVGGKAALVKLIEDNEVNAVKRRVAHEHSG